MHARNLLASGGAQPHLSRSRFSRSQGSLVAQKLAKSKAEESENTSAAEKTLWEESTQSLWDPSGTSRVDLATKGPKNSSHGRTCLEMWLPNSEPYETSLVQLLWSSLFPDPMEPDDNKEWLGVEKGFWEEGRYTKRAEGSEARSAQTLYSRVAREVNAVEGFYASNQIPACFDGKAGHPIQGGSAGRTTGEQRQGKGGSPCGIFEERWRAGRGFALASRSHKKGAWREHDRRNEASTGTHVQFTRETETQADALPSKPDRTSPKGNRGFEEEGDFFGCSMGQIQKGSRVQSRYSALELSGTEEGSLRTIGSKDRDTQATTAGTPESCQLGVNGRVCRFGRGRWRDRPQFRCGHPNYFGSRREQLGTKASETPQTCRARDMKGMQGDVNLVIYGSHPLKDEQANWLELSLASAPPFKAAPSRDEGMDWCPDFDNTAGYPPQKNLTMTDEDALPTWADVLDGLWKSYEYRINFLENDCNDMSRLFGRDRDYSFKSYAAKFATIKGYWDYEKDSNAVKCAFLEQLSAVNFDFTFSKKFLPDPENLPMIFSSWFCRVQGTQVMELLSPLGMSVLDGQPFCTIPAWQHGWSCEYWREVFWNDEWIAFFLGVLLTMLFSGFSLLLVDFWSNLMELWRLGKKRSRYERRVVIICRKRCRQRKCHLKQEWRKSSFFVRYLILWHFCFSFVCGAVPDLLSHGDRTLNEVGDEVNLMQRPVRQSTGWELQLRDWLDIHQLRANQTLVRVWQHQWRRRHVSDSVGQNIWVDKRWSIEEQIRGQLLFFEEEEPMRWSKVTPTPNDHVYKRTHILATGIPYPFFLAVLAEVNNGDRTWYQSVIVEHRQNLVELVDFFNLVWKNNLCAEDYECYTLQPHRTDWPEQIDLFEGELISVFHLPRGRDRVYMEDGSSRCTDVGSSASSSISAGEEYISLVSTNLASRPKPSTGANWATGRYPDHQRLQSDLGQRIEATRAEYDVWEQGAREEALSYTQVQGQDLITSSILDAAEQTDGQVKLHVHGLLTQEVRVERLWLNTLLVRDFLDLLVILRGRWYDVRIEPEMNLHFVSEQPTDTMHEGQNIITLIMDLQPRARLLPILVVTRLDQQGYPDSYDIRAYKHESLINCGDLKRITGLSMLCIHNARCACSKDHNVIHEEELLPISAGTMLMVHIYFDLQRCQWESGHENLIGDEVGLMQNPLGGSIPFGDPFLAIWLYGYCHGLTEPIRAWRGGSGELSPAIYLAQQLSRILDTVLKEQIFAFKVFPIPGDLVRRSTETYMY